MVKNRLPTVKTLAIGDGTNDVAMIKAAHIGIGIKGLEGTEAASSADYAIGTFKFSKRLMFAHGRNFAFKIESYIYLFMWKSIFYATTVVPIAVTTGFSGSPTFSNLYYAGFTTWTCNLDSLWHGCYD